MKLVRFAPTIAAAALLCAAGGLQAQDDRPRDGFWLGFGAGVGKSYITCDICDPSARGTSFSGSLRFGLTLNPGLLLGLEGNVWWNSEEVTNERMGSLSLLAYWYPNAAKGLYLLGGAAFIGYRRDVDEGVDEENRNDKLTSTTYGPQIGVGYEIRLSPAISLTPYFNAVIGLPIGDLNFNDERLTDGVGLAMLQLGLGFTLH